MADRTYLDTLEDTLIRGEPDFPECFEGRIMVFSPDREAWLKHPGPGEHDFSLVKLLSPREVLTILIRLDDRGIFHVTAQGSQLTTGKYVESFIGTVPKTNDREPPVIPQKNPLCVTIDVAILVANQWNFSQVFGDEPTG